MENTVFVSHATVDNPRLAELLRKVRGCTRIWFAEHDIGPSCNIPLEIARALDASSHLLICWSDAASKSSVVLDELSAFYMRRPQPERILHLRLDSTPILSLFAARKYVWFRDEDSIEMVVKVIAGWATRKDGSVASKIEEEPFAPPTPEMLHQFPLGPRVRRHPAMDVVAGELSGSLKDKALAMRVITEAQDLRRRADPEIEEHRITINLGLVPAIEAGTLFFWSAVIEEASTKGPRMLAALLLVHDDLFFSVEGKKARAELLKIMRKM